MKVDFNEYNKPPFLPGWMNDGETLELAKTFDFHLEELNEANNNLQEQYNEELLLENDALLDRRGFLLGIERQGNNNKDYLLQQELRILLNLNNSTIPDIIKLLKAYYTAEVIHIEPRYPAGIKILHDGLSPIGVDFNRFIVEVVGAGIAFETRELFVYKDKIKIKDNLLKLKILMLDEVHYNGRFNYNGEITYGGQYWINNETRTKDSFCGLVDKCEIRVLNNSQNINIITMEG